MFFEIIFSLLGDKETNVCTMVDIQCYIDAGDRFSKDLMVKHCKCLPDCTSITYALEISQTPIQFLNSEDDFAHWNSQNESRWGLNITFDISKSKLNFFFVSSLQL